MNMLLARSRWREYNGYGMSGSGGVTGVYAYGDKRKILNCNKVSFINLKERYYTRYKRIISADRLYSLT